MRKLILLLIPILLVLFFCSFVDPDYHPVYECNVYYSQSSSFPITDYSSQGSSFYVSSDNFSIDENGYLINTSASSISGAFLYNNQSISFTLSSNSNEVSVRQLINSSYGSTTGTVYYHIEVLNYAPSVSDFSPLILLAIIVLLLVISLVWRI